MHTCKDKRSVMDSSTIPSIFTHDRDMNLSFLCSLENVYHNGRYLHGLNTDYSSAIQFQL